MGASVGLDEPWKREMERRMTRLEAYIVVGFGITLALLVPMFIKAFWG